MKQKILGTILLFISYAAQAGVYFQGTFQVPGVYGSISSYNYQHRPPVYQYQPPVYRQYLEPPQYPDYDSRFKPSDYYRNRNSCFPYPINDQFGRVIGYTWRCM